MKYLLTLVMMFTIAMAHAENDCTRPDSDNPEMQALAGESLTAKEAGDMEAAVAKHPDDLSGRTKLLGYYFRRQYSSKGEENALRKHVLWIIENRPEARIAEGPFCRIDPAVDKDGYDQAKQLWLKQAQSHPENAVILGHAAGFFVLNDEDLAENLFKKAQAVEPGNPKWPDRLGHLYALESRKDSAAKSLAAYELAQAADNSEDSRFVRLDDLAKSAFEAGDMEKASRYANDLLKVSGKYPDNWNYGNAIHHGNNVLGRIALKRGDTKRAGEFLLKAGATRGSPQLDSFGPNMTLARELLQKGEKETVLRYFELCRKFWEMGGERLDTWTHAVKNNQIPDFGANLRY